MSPHRMVVYHAARFECNHIVKLVNFSVGTPGKLLRFSVENHTQATMVRIGCHAAKCMLCSRRCVRSKGMLFFAG